MNHLLILGATSDIAQAVAYRFAKEGFSLTLAARQVERLLPVKEDLSLKMHVQTHLVEFDATDYNHHHKFYRQLPAQPDVVLCAFGYLGDQFVAQQHFTEVKHMIDTNFTGAVSILNVIANDFEQRQEGTIIGLSSVAGERGRQSNYLYGSTKAAFTAYLDGLRHRLYKSRGHVITVKPGYVKTKMIAGMQTPSLLTARPEQVANHIFKGYKRRSDTVYILRIWRIIMAIVRNIPENFFKNTKL